MVGPGTEPPLLLLLLPGIDAEGGAGGAVGATGLAGSGCVAPAEGGGGIVPPQGKRSSEEGGEGILRALQVRQRGWTRRCAFTPLLAFSYRLDLETNEIRGY